MTREVWERGAAYESYVGRWSRPVAEAFLGWLAVGEASRWIDVGCGTGALTETILRVSAPAAVRAIDASAEYADFARAAISDPRARFEVADARALPIEDSWCDAAVSGLVLNFVPEPERMVREMMRVVRAGGTVAAYVWDYAAGMELMRIFWDAAIDLDPAALALDEGRRFPICSPDPLRELWRSAGLGSIQVQEIVIPTGFTDFEDYWAPFLGGQGPAPGYAMALDPGRRAALRERIRERLTFRADGSIELSARAWAVRGTRA